MKTKLVLWATNEKEEKSLLAYQLRAEDNIVDLWTFSGENASNDVHRALMYEWREGKEMAFPSEGYVHHEMELTVANSMLPAGFKTEKEELVTRAQTEWHFVVLSAKLNSSYLSELEDLEEKVKGTASFQPGLWEELVGFWDKVQSQVRERNLSRDHANTLRDKTNDLFSMLKELRKKLDVEFKGQAKTVFDKFIGIIDHLDKKIESGGNMASLFNELKDIQTECRNAKLTRDLRSKLWDRIDASFKVVKEKRFGPEGASGNSPLERIERRYQGLMKAIKRMEHSIQRDEKDLNFQRSKVDSSDAGQLETQLREAKMKVISVQVDSKKAKLADMHKTRDQLEKQIEKEKAKAAKAKPVEKKQEPANKDEQPKDAGTASEKITDTTEPAKTKKKTATPKEDKASSETKPVPKTKAAEKIEKPADEVTEKTAKPKAKAKKEETAKSEPSAEAKPEAPKATKKKTAKPKAAAKKEAKAETKEVTESTASTAKAEKPEDTLPESEEVKT